MKSVVSNIVRFGGLTLAILFFAISQSAQSTSVFRVGEKLTYQISFDRFTDVGYAELYVASAGKLAGRDAVEVRARVKTQDFVSAAFFLVDQSRTIYAAPDTGLPMYLSNVDSGGVVPKETIQNYLTEPTTNFDFVLAIYRARANGGGTFPIFENGQQYLVTFQPGGATEKLKTDAGEFDTTVSTITSDYLTNYGIKDFRVNFSTDENRLPVLFRFRRGKSEIRATLAAVSRSEPAATPSPTPEPVRTPVPQSTARPTPSPTPYVDDRPLAPELGFAIGESLDYRVTNGGTAAGTITLKVKERKLINGQDSLVLVAEVTAIEPGGGLFSPGDNVRSLVDPDTLAPRSVDVIFKNAIPGLNGTATFDNRTGEIRAGAVPPFEAPVGTHSILSLIYAMRSFNLTPSRDPSSPVNDTRVAVFWDSKVQVFTLRPSKPGEIQIGGAKLQAQLISITTGNPQLDALAPKVWLSTSERRTPVRFAIGLIQADLIQK